MASKEQVFEAAMERWGIKSQLDMVAEECCELAVVALKIYRANNGRNTDNLAEEMADVELCLEQICNYFDLREQIDGWKDKKLRRLAYLIESTNPNKEKE